MGLVAEDWLLDARDQAIPFSLSQSLAAGVTSVLRSTVIWVVFLATVRSESRLKTAELRCVAVDAGALGATVDADT